MTKLHQSKTVNGEQMTQTKKFVPQVRENIDEMMTRRFGFVFFYKINLSTGKSERLQSLYLQMPSMSGGFQAKGDAG